MKKLELKIPPLLWVIDAAFCMWGTSVLFPAFAFELPYSRLIGLCFALLGLSLALYAIHTFRRSSTTVNPLTPEKSSSLVVGGPYRYTRNPMYLGMLFILFGCYIALSNALACIFMITFVLIMTWLQIQPEERALLNIFGSEYEEYRKTVRRWLGRSHT